MHCGPLRIHILLFFKFESFMKLMNNISSNSYIATVVLAFNLLFCYDWIITIITTIIFTIICATSTGFRGVDHRNSCNISQHPHEHFQQLALNISTILHSNKCIIIKVQSKTKKPNFCYLLISINLADILKSILSLTVNFETFFDNALAFLCFIPCLAWCLSKPREDANSLP